MAVAEEDTELLGSYKLVVKVLLETYATDAVILEENSEVLGYRQRRLITELFYSMTLWTLATRCGNVFDTMRVKYMYVDGVLDDIRAQVRTYCTRK